MATAFGIEDFAAPDYDPFLADEINFGDSADPYPLIHRMRSQGAVLPGSYRQRMGMTPAPYPTENVFTIVGTKEVTAALTDQERFSNAAYQLNLGTSFGLGSITIMDNPDHGRWRRIFQKTFLPQHVRKWGESIVDPVVARLMAPFLPTGRADLVKQFTILYPFEVIYSQLALPAEDLRVFQRLAIGQTDFITPGRCREAGAKLGDYYAQLIAERRARPGDDLVSVLATIEVDGEHLPPLVLLSFLRQLMNAGGDTTYRGTSILPGRAVASSRAARSGAERSHADRRRDRGGAALGRPRVDGDPVRQGRHGARRRLRSGGFDPGGAVRRRQPIPPSGRTPIDSTSFAGATRIGHSGAVRISASASIWRGWR